MRSTVLRSVPGGAAAGPTKRGRPASSSHRRVVEAAIAIADEQGLSAVSLRTVAQRLGVHQTSLYTYIGSKEALLRAMLDYATVEQVAVPTPEDARSPADQLRDMFVSLRDLASRHPELLALVGRTRATATGPLAALDAVCRLLSEMGLAPDRQVQVFNLLYHQTIANALLMGNLRLARSSGEVAPAAAVDAADYPYLAAARAGEISAPGEAFEVTLDVILNVLVPQLSTS